jgi:hypothetical protein
MCIRVALNVTLIIALTLVSQVTGAYSQSKPSPQDGLLKSYKVVSQETYNRVLDILFPQGDLGVVTIVLRFEPSFQPESQIIIRKDLDKAEVIEYTSLSGNIYSKLNDVMAHGGKEDAVEMAKLIKVRRRSVEVPYAQIKQWHTGLLASIRESLNVFKEKLDEYDTGTSTIALDGTFYDLWYEQVGDKFSFKLYDEEINDLRSTGKFKLVQWMNTVRRDVRKLK